MTPEAKITWAVALVGLVVAGVLLFGPQVKEELEPELVRAWVAVEEDASGRAVVGHHQLSAGRPFTLHGVLEARRRGGEAVYYTDAPALVIGGREVPAEELRTWDRLGVPRLRWFTVEGENPSLKVSEAQELEALPWRELLRPDWPDAWAIPGLLTPYAAPDENRAALYDAGGDVFGTQRFHVRIEIYRDPDAPVPTERYRYWGAEALAALVAGADPAAAPVEAAFDATLKDFPGVTVRLSGSLAAPSAVFGLTQVVPAADAPEAVARIRERADALAADALAFARLPLVRRAMVDAGVDPANASWQPLDLAAGEPWGEEIQPGDLIRVVDRVVQLWQEGEGGRAGVLDPQDLCFDFVRGATVRPLSQVFAGGGEVQWLSL